MQPEKYDEENKIGTGDLKCWWRMVLALLGEELSILEVVCSHCWQLNAGAVIRPGG